MIKIQWIASIWRQNDQNVELRRKTFKTKLNYKSDQNPMTCIDWTSKRSKTFKTEVNYKSDQNPMNLHRFDVKTIKMLRYVAKHSKQRKTTKLIKLQWIASIWRQNDQNIQNKAKLQKWSKSNELHRFDVKTIKMLSYVAKHSKQSKTTKVIKLQWIASIWYQSDQNNAKLQKQSNYDKFASICQNVKTIKMLRYFAKHSKQRKTTKVIKLQWIASIWRQNDQNVELRCKTFKTNLNYKSDQNPMTCIDWMSKRSKQRYKLQKSSKPNDLHRFDVKTIKMLSYVAKHSKQRKTTKLIKTMSCIDLTSKLSKCWGTFAKHSKQTQNYESDQNPMTCIDWMSKTI